MHTLHNTQAAFADALLDADKPTPSALRGRSEETPIKRFSVYRNNVIVSLVDAVVSAYPATCKIVGDNFFRAMARVYVDQNPPRTPMMFAYAADFPAFIEGFEPVSQLPYLSNVARIEAARRKAYHAADEKPVGIEILSRFDPADMAGLTFKLQSSLGLLRSSFAAFSVWFDNSEFGPAQGPIDIKNAEDTLIVRPHLTVETRRLPIGGAAFINGLSQGKTLGEAVDAATNDAAALGHSFELPVHLTGLFETGAVIDVSTEDVG